MTLFGKFDLIEIKLIKLDIFKIELLQLDSIFLITKWLDISCGIKKQKCHIVKLVHANLS